MSSQKPPQISTSYGRNLSNVPTLIAQRDGVSIQT